MEVPTVNKSFFFLSLQNGGLLLSWLGLVASFSGLISAIVLLSIGVDSQLDNDLAPNEKKVSVAILNIALVIFLLISIGTFVSSFCLLRGIRVNSLNLVKTWLIIQGVCVVLYLAAAFVQLAVSFLSFLIGLLLTCGLIVGSLGVFFGIISLAVWSVVSINLDAAIREIDDPEVRNSLNEIRWLLITLLIIYIISAVLTIIVSALLIYGTVKSNERFIAPWLVIEAISIVLSVIASFMQIVVSIPAFITSIIVVAFSAYIWLCIYSLFENVRLANTGAQPMQPFNTAPNQTGQIYVPQTYGASNN